MLAGGIMLGHPPTDCPEQGSRVVVITDGDRDLAAREALHVGLSFWNMRSHMQCVLHSVEEGIRIAAKATGTVVFADAADATSSGAPGTSNTILKGFLESGYRGSVLFPIRDDPAVERAMEAGVGSTVTVPLGGTRGLALYPGGGHRDGRSAGPAGRNPHRGFEVPQHHNLRRGLRPPALRPLDVSRLRAGPETLRRRRQETPAHTPDEWYDDWAERTITIDSPGAASPNIPTLGHRFVTRPIYPLDPDMTFTPRGGGVRITPRNRQMAPRSCQLVPRNRQMAPRSCPRVPVPPREKT